MGKRTAYTKITPLPHNIPRQLALDMLHSHVEVIELNPLVTGVQSVEAPRNAASDEFFSQWYEISQIITWGFGIKKKISFKGVFHNQPWGLQTHVYAPMGVDLRNKYRIGGNQPGEPREARELGLDIPQDGLYLREDVEIECAVPLTASFVKKEHKAATGTMIARLTKKAELLDEGKLHAMFQNGLLKTSKPNTNPTFADRPIPSPHSTPSSPALTNESPSISAVAPVADDKGYGRYHDIVQRQASQMERPISGMNQHYQHAYPPHGQPTTGYPSPIQNVHEVQGSMYYANAIGVPSASHYQPYAGQYKPEVHQFRAELPGDISQPQQPQYQAYSDPRRLSSNIADPEKSLLANAANHPANRHSYSSSHDRAPDQNKPEKNEPDHAQLSRLSLGASPPPPPLPQPARAPGVENATRDGTRIINCPVCNVFDGDAAAVSHHIEKMHFG